MQQKKPLIIVAVVLGLIVVIGGGIWAATRFIKDSTAPPVAEEKRRRAEPVNVIPVADRPYLQIVPKADGRNLELVVVSLNKPATEAEYELEYQSGSQLQGAFGLLDLAQLPSSFTILLGSCSAGGACTFHEDVQGGTLVTRFSGPENYALKSDWRYIDNAAKHTGISSKDAKFQLESSALAAVRYVVVFNTAGYPAGLPGTPVSDPYSLTASSALSGNGKLAIRANEDGPFTVYGWDGDEWHAFPTESDGKMAMADVSLMELYIVVKE